ncbi:MAG: DUF1566 domain-containing protein, partial [Massilia sp.]
GGGGGGGGGSIPVTPAPKPTAILAVSSPVASQATVGQSLLAFRVALGPDTVFPVTFTYTISGAVGGASCGAGVDFVVPAATGLTVTPGVSTTGTLVISSSSAERQLNLLVCPGSGSADKTLALHWSDSSPAGIGDTVATIRASTNTAIDKSKRLNDTGITACANATAVGLGCPQTGFAGQDAENGRDAQVNVIGAPAYRTSAFALTNLPNAICIQDNVTGLVWEGKSTSGLHAAGSTYTWLQSGGANGGAAGTANGGVCSGSGCDTEKFVAAVNAEALCSFTDWRLPSADELAGIVDSGAAVAPTSRAQFANQAAAPYWSASPRALANSDAWNVDFNSGAIGFAAKSSAYRVRLVRGH